METTDYCDYNLSKKLKECGFDEPCDTYYDAHGTFHQYQSTDRVNRNTNGHHTPSCSAPTLWQAQKWLREKHHISIRVSYIAYHKRWFADWLNLDSGEFDDFDESHPSYESALSAGIESALELIKEKEE